MAAYTREELWELVMTTARDAAINVFANPRRAAIARASRTAPALGVTSGGNYDETGTYRPHFHCDGSKLDGTDGLR